MSTNTWQTLYGSRMKSHKCLMLHSWLVIGNLPPNNLPEIPQKHLLIILIKLKHKQVINFPTMWPRTIDLHFALEKKWCNLAINIARYFLTFQNVFFFAFLSRSISFTIPKKKRLTKTAQNYKSEQKITWLANFKVFLLT